MTKIICTGACVYSINGVCAREEIEMSVEGCESWKEYPQKNDPEYQNEYWISTNVCDPMTKERKVYRVKRNGKKVEFGGLTFYTEEDIRYGYINVAFTEERTGVAVNGNYLNEEGIEKIKESSAKYPDVMSLPVYEKE